MVRSFSFKATARLWPGETAAWHFALVPKDVSKTLRDKHKSRHRGWNSIKVRLSLGKTKWDTSIFFDTKSGQYLLPLKAQVRRQEGIFDGDEVDITMSIV